MAEPSTSDAASAGPVEATRSHLPPSYHHRSSQPRPSTDDFSDVPAPIVVRPGLPFHATHYFGLRAPSTWLDVDERGHQDLSSLLRALTVSISQFYDV